MYRIIVGDEVGVDEYFSNSADSAAELATIFVEKFFRSSLRRGWVAEHAVTRLEEDGFLEAIDSNDAFTVRVEKVQND